MNYSQSTSEKENEDRLAPLGRILFGAGILLIAARGLTLTTRMAGLPSFWYANQPTWLIVGFGMTGLGWWVLWRLPRQEFQEWQPGMSGRRFHTAVLYVSEGCHLCDDAAEILSRYHRWLPQVQEVDIHTDPLLKERFCECVPVVAFDGKVRFRGRIDETLLRRLIEGTPPKTSL